MALKVVILAAGKGTRMRSHLPKVLQPLAQKPLLQHVIDTAQSLHCDEIITVIGHGAEQVKSRITGQNLLFTLQEEQLGTGHAVMQANAHYSDSDTVLILYGDVPLTAPSTLKKLLELIDAQHPLALLTVTLENPSGYGRIVRDSTHAVQAIVEQKDANAEVLAIKEVNTGIMAVKGAQLKKWLSTLDNRNAQSEYYLTDIIAMAVSDGFSIQTTQPDGEIEVLGVNDKMQLQSLERQYQYQSAKLLMQQGATVVDAQRLDVRGTVTVEPDVTLDVNVVLEGTVCLGKNVTVGAHCILKNVQIAENTHIHPFSHLEDCIVGQDCSIGPYARLRPGTELANEARIGNFVEIKKSKIGVGSKVSHLSYIGDTVMGRDVNIGAGTITCNYDGVNKYQTIIGDGVFIGSDTQLVAPVEIDSGASIGAGSTITKDVPANELTLSRSKQVTIKGWQKPTK
ncbi:N-acetylglucosamine-1-phosphate uridyltransferase / Glucosamine-1-phosphate N-acetyltransferase [hydrothermal vent metagenome]|uniref:N-acetylglucosamine-1-phosphate uridyltransferase / Glucosamine-1-phosphate N-acetyltransferase n=1 Tax=hydrothermal vent metagenome TaxID=652676 RepID=A0A3B0VT93_9ZZZZ